MKVIQRLKRIMPRLSNYYLALSILFLTSAVTLDYIWSSLLWLFIQSLSPLFEINKITGIIGWQVIVFLYVAIVLFIVFLSWKIKNKILSYIVGAPA